MDYIWKSLTFPTIQELLAFIKNRDVQPKNIMGVYHKIKWKFWPFVYKEEYTIRFWDRLM